MALLASRSPASQPSTDATPITVKSLNKVFQDKEGDVAAVNNVSFVVPRGSFFTLLGPSGCGKTTTLRCLAGLEKADGGDILFGDEVMSSPARRIFVPTHRRRIGMVFQSYAVWPHMTVFDNVAYPLRTRGGLSRSQISERVGRVLELVGLAGYERRPSTRLSGGQQQRVAVARALAGQPKVLLFDEPLSNLDAKLREEMRHELRQLQQKFSITTVYVTHDQQEALAISDQVAIMNAGKLVEVGSPWQVYHAPQTAFTAGFIGLANNLEGEVVSVGRQDEMSTVQTPIGTLLCRSNPGVASGAAVQVFIRPEAVVVSAQPQIGANVLTGQVGLAQFLGECLDCFIKVGNSQIRIRTAPSRLPGNGETVYCTIPPEAIIVLPATPA